MQEKKKPTDWQLTLPGYTVENRSTSAYFRIIGKPSTELSVTKFQKVIT